MKKLFALFCAVFLMPSFSAHAWIGGPFSGNSFFGNEGDDGVYEAVASPIGNSFQNGVGIFRWGMANSSAFPEGSTISIVTTNPFFGTTTTITLPAVPISSNVYFGGIGQISHSWFIEGVSYRGTCEGSTNSGLNKISCVGTANVRDADGTVDPDRFVSSGFSASFEGSGDALPLARFAGKGRGRSEDRTNPADIQSVNFSFLVLGTKVSNFVSYAGVLDTIN